MSVSGVLLGCRPDRLEAVIERLGALPWARVHYPQPDGRMVVTIEGSVHDSVDRVRVLQKLPDVLMAEMVELRLEEGETPPASEPRLEAWEWTELREGARSRRQPEPHVE